MSSPLARHRDLEPRLNAFRDDLAAASLKGRVNAKNFTRGTPAWVRASHAFVHRKPEAAAPVDTEVLFGEQVTIYDRTGGWAWVQLDRDGYVGYVRDTAFATNATPSGKATQARQVEPQASHRVSAIGTFVYPSADIKAPPLTDLPMNALLHVTGAREKFLALEGGGYVIARHTAPIDEPALDFVEIAERFIGTPYLWGGRTRRGIDCSGLVQLSLQAAGISAPRDSDMQQKELGQDVLVPSDLEGLERGDLVFWPGHVGIMTGSIFLLHANAHHMAVVMEPLRDTAQRVARNGTAISAIKRLCVTT